LSFTDPDTSGERSRLVPAHRGAFRVRRHCDHRVAIVGIMLFWKRHEGTSLLLPERREMAITHDRPKPRFHVGPSECVKSTERAQDRLLHDVIGVMRGT
jgi:hypothetical protein